MKVTIKNAQNADAGSIELPKQFEEEIRVDLIRRAVLAIEANNRQRYGVDPRAGKKYSSNLSKRRKKYRGSYGLGISRTPRKILSRNGTRFNWVGATVPFTVGGRVAHPPKAEKMWDQKVNKKERRKALRSALSASVSPVWVERRGHALPEGFPFVIDNDFEAINKTKAFTQALTAVGAQADLARSAKVKTRGGAAALRGRRKKVATGPLIVVSQKCDAQIAARNIPGVEVVEVKDLNAKLLAPGTHAGRLTLYTKGAIERIVEGGLFA